MAFKTRRQRRYEILRIAGCLPFEARDLSKVPFRVPYMDVLVKERYKKFVRAREEGRSWVWWKREIIKEYRDNRWQSRTRLGVIKDDPYKMLKNFEHNYKDRHPQYESPWMKRRKQWRSFLTKIEREYEQLGEKYPRGYGESKRERYARMRAEMEREQ